VSAKVVGKVLVPLGSKLFNLLQYSLLSIMRGEPMGNLSSALQQLREERRQAQEHVDKLDRAILEIESLHGSGSSRSASQAPRTVSAASRRKMARAQKARWASIRKEAQPGAGATKTTGLTIVKRTMSASGRRKIAAAQKARWAKFRAEQKKAA
jgi:hypothetical protein